MLTRLRLLFLKPFALLANWYFKPPVPFECNYFDGQASTFLRLHVSKSNLRIRQLENSKKEQGAVQKVVCDGIMSIAGNLTPFTTGTTGASCVMCTFIVGGGMVVSMIIRKILGIVDAVWVSDSAISNVFIYFVGIFTAYMVAFTLFPYMMFFKYLLHAKEADMKDPYAHYGNNDFNRRFFVAAIKSESDPSDEVIVGTIAVQEPESLSPFNPGTDAEIRRVSIVPAVRGQGIARMLYNRVETFVRQHESLKRIVLSTSSLQHKALMMYKHYGFRELARKRVVGGVLEIVFLAKSLR